MLDVLFFMQVAIKLGKSKCYLEGSHGRMKDDLISALRPHRKASGMLSGKDGWQMVDGGWWIIDINTPKSPKTEESKRWKVEEHLNRKGV